jgi:hypothetical protein
MRSLAGTTWKLIKSRTVDRSGRQVPSPLGPEPMGALVFEDARLMIMFGDGRPHMPCALSPHGSTACCGSYSFDGHTLAADIDAASRSGLLGEFIRWVRFDGPRQMVSKEISCGVNVITEMTWEQVD